MKKRKRIVIIGAAGRDFHNFNTLYRDNKEAEVVAFTAAQIPGIAGRRYPKELAGKYYPKGIPIEEEKNLGKVIKEKKVDECVLSYSDLPYETVMRIGSLVLASGAKFSMMGINNGTMIKSKKPVIAVVAVRTGCGKSQTVRSIVEILREAKKRVVSVRHPMPYGHLADQKIQRYDTLDDMKKYNCTIEEMEEYEPHINMGSIIYSGVDYGVILKKAEKEADIIVWDGGNNDMSFYRPDLTVTVVDPFRAGHEIKYYPGEVNFRCADVIIINKIDSADPRDVLTIVENAKKYNPQAKIIKAESVITVTNPEVIKGKRVLVIEDGPTLTHGEMEIGAGTVAAKRYGAKELIDPRPYAVGTMKETFKKYSHIGLLLPAMGYGEKQIRDLEKTIDKTDCEAVVIGTPIDLSRFMKINKPCVRVKYNLSSQAKKELKNIIKSKKLI